MILSKNYISSDKILMFLELTLISSLCIAISMDQKHMGDLYYQHGSSIHSLAWIIKLSSHCNIEQILTDNFSCNYFVKTIFNQSIFNVILLKKLEPFINTYIVAHPYYKVFRKLKRKYYQNHAKYIASYNFCIEKRRETKKNNTCYQPKLPHINENKIYVTTRNCANQFLSLHPCIEYFKQEILRKRTKRMQIEFKDPLYKYQWHLDNPAQDEFDINVMGAWESGITGHGVTVCVVDDGLEWRHPDLRDNYNAQGSYDLNADDVDPSPVKNGERNEHGTRCAGEIAAIANNMCGVGVAYRANISGIRVLGERITDSLEAAAFVQGLNVNDIYSCSWGPNDDGMTVDGPHYLAQKALLHGVTYGRKGYGAIYVVASGNGGKNKDNCNFDGYANSVYTLTIGAVDSKGTMPFYAEECATMLAVMPSSGSNGKAIVTTDWFGSSKTGCTFQHSGTSAATPLAAAVIALALEMQPCLSWRDVQYLIAFTSRKINVENSDWILNQAGLHHSHQHGFGLMDAAGIVSAAAVWESVPFSTVFRSNVMVINQKIPSLPHQSLVINHTVSETQARGYALHILEYVQIYVSLKHEFRGSLKISLSCPSGTQSILASPRKNDNSSYGLKNWPLGTVRCWGEIPWGVYTFSVMHTHSIQLKGKLISIQLVLHGSPMTPEQFNQRKRLVNRAVKGEAVQVNRSRLCHLPELTFAPFSSLSDQTVKILSLTGIFLFLMAVYNTLEYILCYNMEKKKFYQHLRDLIYSHSMIMKRGPSSTRFLAPSVDVDESLTTLLDSGRNSCECLEDITIVQRDLSAKLISASEQHLYCPPNLGMLSSPTPSCEGDVSSNNADSDSEDDETISSRNTSDTIIPRDTDVSTNTTTDFTTDHTTSEADELDKKSNLREYHS